jgi:hypothetical protein
MDGADIGMVERQGRPRFAFEAPQRLQIAPCRRNHCVKFVRRKRRSLPR